MHRCNMHAKDFINIIPVIAMMAPHLAFEGDLEVHKQQADARNGQPV